MGNGDSGKVRNHLYVSLVRNTELARRQHFWKSTLITTTPIEADVINILQNLKSFGSG